MRMARAALVLALCFPYGAFAAGKPVVLNVKDYGATGDGVTDDYTAMKAAAAALCASPSGSRLVYPPGTYRINQYRVFRGPTPNGVNDVVYQNCVGVTISGYGAKIDVKGDFYMAADFFADGQWYSYSKQVTPFFMADSTDFTIEGFEMYGNVDKMTKDSRVLEDSCAGVTTRHCQRYLLHDLNIHHFSVDSIQLGFLDFDDAMITDKDARIENVTCHHDGRVTMAIIHVRRAWIINSSFMQAGETEGAFGGFVPEAGSDVEPDFTVAGDGMDMPTGEIYFINSSFSGNRGPELLAAFPDRVDSVTVYGTNITTAPAGEAAYALVVGSKTGLVEKTNVDLRNGKGVLFGTWDSGPLSSIVGITFANNVFQLATNGALLSEGTAAYDFVNNNVSVNAGAQDLSVMDFTGLRTVAKNTFFIDASGGAALSEQTVIRTDGAPTVLGNTYQTNLAAGGRHFAALYGNGSVKGEMFPSAPFFMPAGVNWNSTSPYPQAAPTVTDTTPPAISNVAALQYSASTLISWLTDEPATSVVEYGTTVSYGSTQQITEPTRDHPVFLTNLQLGLTYHYRVRSTDPSGNFSVSADATFTMPLSRPPVVTTTSATAITATSATLNGTVNPNAASTTTTFDYGIATAYGSSVAGQTRTGTTTQAISAAVTLTCGTTYHFRAMATNSQGTRYGADQTVTTTACRCTSFSITPSSASPSYAAGSQLVTVTGAPNGCAGGSWSAQGNGTWLDGSPSTGSGSGSATVSWLQNPFATPRSGTVTIAGQTFSATQGGAPACSYAISPLSTSGAAASGTGNIQVSGVPTDCAGSWSAASGGVFLALTGVASGSGAGPWQVPYSYPANPNMTLTRQDSVTFTGAFPSGAVFTLTQNAGALRKVAADFNGDHKSDILWYHNVSGETYLWTMDSYNILSTGWMNETPDLNWKIAGVADFDGDGTADILWRNAATGENYMWLINSGAIVGAGTINRVTDLNWKIVGTADYDGDGRADILWRNASNGQNYLYLMNGLSILQTGSLNTISDNNWKVVASGDLNGDGKADIVWRHGTTGDTYAWLMDGFTTVGAGMIATVPDQNWTIIAVADFNGDGKADVFWRNAATGENYLYLMNGPSVVSADWVNVVDDPNWKIVAVADYNGDGKADVVWRNVVTGENYLYLMDGFSIVTGTYLPQVPDAGWTVVR